MVDGVRVTQKYLEALVTPESDKAVRVTQAYGEALVKPQGDPALRVSTVWAEILLPKDYVPLQVRTSTVWMEVLQSRRDEPEVTPGRRQQICN